MNVNRIGTVNPNKQSKLNKKEGWGVRLLIRCFCDPQAKGDFELRMNYALNYMFLHAPPSTLKRYSVP